MRFKSKQTNEGDELKLLSNLKDDLRILYNSWKKKKLRQKKALKHFVGIIDSVANLARSESLEPFEIACAELKEQLKSVAEGTADFEDGLWSRTASLMNSMAETMKKRAQADDDGHEDEAVARELEAEESEMDVSPASADDGDESRSEEEKGMISPNQIDPQKLLQEAQDALLSGNGENAKELALKAADLIAQIAVEEARQKEKNLRENLERIVMEASEAEESIQQLREELDGRDQELSSARERMDEAETALKDREGACEEIKREIDLVATELEALTLKQGQLHDRLQEILPAREAAHREFSRLKKEFESLDAEVDPARESIAEAEAKLAKAQQEQAEIEAALKELEERVAA